MSKLLFEYQNPTGRPRQKIKRQKLHSVDIKVVSPKQIRQWAEHSLPNGELVGEVTSWETVNYKTLKPEPNGLFCQKIFGPEIDYTCACGKNLLKVNQKMCPKCGVECTTSRTRRSRLGYIRLHQPVVNPMYGSGKQSHLEVFLETWSRSSIQTVESATSFCAFSPKFQVFTSFRDIFRLMEFVKLESKQVNPSSGLVDVRTLHSEIPKQLPPQESFCFKDYGFGQKQFQQAISDSSNFSAPKLFQKLNQKQTTSTFQDFKKNPFIADSGFQIINLSTQTLDIGLHLYGFCYHQNWKVLDSFQDILSYLWEYPDIKDNLISYYRFVAPVENFVAKNTPRYPDGFPIQTGGLVFQRQLAHLNLKQFHSRASVLYSITEKQVTNSAALHRYLYVQLFWKRLHQIIEKFHLDHGLEKYELIEDFPNLTMALKKMKGPFVKKLKKLLKKEIEPFKEKLKTDKTFVQLLQQLDAMKQTNFLSWKYSTDFVTQEIQPSWLILSYLPVLPPGLRPITPISGELFVADSNNLYRRILTRNTRFHEPKVVSVWDVALGGRWNRWCFCIKLLRDAIVNLLKTGTVERGKKLKSLIEGLKGKKGRFRQHLLGKRVDYSGRSVIVVDPSLKIHECGIPKQMALELFQPFLIRKLRERRIHKTAIGAKLALASPTQVIWEILGEIISSHPILLNRAPTLHRLGIQAFLPKMVDGKAILLHPLVCTAFNADFDGDQMAVHVPLTAAARSEAFSLLWSIHHILAPASGQPLLLPSQDMVLGCYYLTIDALSSALNHFKYIKNNGPSLTKTRFWNGYDSRFIATPEYYFLNFEKVLESYNRGILNTHDFVWIRWDETIQNFIGESQAKCYDLPLESSISGVGNSCHIFSDRCEFTKNRIPLSTYIRTTAGRIVFHDLLMSLNKDKLDTKNSFISS